MLRVPWFRGCKFCCCEAGVLLQGVRHLGPLRLLERACTPVVGSEGPQQGTPSLLGPAVACPPPPTPPAIPFAPAPQAPLVPAEGALGAQGAEAASWEDLAALLEETADQPVAGNQLVAVLRQLQGMLKR